MIPALLGLPGRVKTLLDRLTAARAGYLDNLDAAVTTRLGSIKSVQRGTISVTAANASATATISSVNTSKSIIFWLGETGGASAVIRSRIELTNGTTVTAYVDKSSSVDVALGYQVIEFN